MAASLDDIIVAFDAIFAKATATATAILSLQTLGAYPATPVIVSDDIYAAWIAAIATWETAKTNRISAVDTAKEEQINAEVDLITLLDANVNYFIEDDETWGGSYYISYPIQKRFDVNDDGSPAGFTLYYINALQSPVDVFKTGPLPPTE